MLVYNAEKFKNSIQLEMDMYNTGRFLNSTTFPKRHKRYEFELFEDDIIKSPFNHEIWACEMNVKVTTLYEIDQFMQFLENLKMNMIGTKNKEK